jgi:hypothetical protein
MTSKKKSKFDSLLKSLNIDETYTKPAQKEKVFTKVRSQIPLIKHFNYMADILYLPKTKEGYKYCLVVVDLATNLFDIEPLKSKHSDNVLEALKKMYKRDFIKQPFASVQTDGGTEFKDKFHKYLSDNEIYHRQTLPNRHSQNSVVESLNRQLGRIFNGYMNAKEEETGKQYNEWLEIVDTVRKQLNEIREIKLDEDFNKNMQPLPPMKKMIEGSEFNVGDIVYRKNEVPYNQLGHKQTTSKFREGDLRFNTKEPRKIIKVIPMDDKYVAFRYVLENLLNVSYTDKQLMKAKDNEKESKYIFERILDKRKNGGFIEYLIKWKGYKKNKSTWEKKADLIKDGLKDEIDDYENSL